MEKRRGRQEPTVGFTLPYTETRGSEAVELYNKTGRIAQEWQEGLLYDILATNEEGLWTHTRYGFSVPRQNGKNEVVAIRELLGLRNGERILHTAHRTSTSRAAWDRLVFLLDALGIGEKSAANPQGYTSGKSKGQEFIYLPDEWGGGKIQFRTRTTTGGLGETFDLLVIDEAQEYQDDQESALKYTIVSSDNPQTIFLGTPPTVYSSGTIFPKLRQRILCGESKNSGWAEWSVDEETNPKDIEAWYQTNPSLGYKLTERAIEDEVGEDVTDFNIQRLGLWIKYNQKSAISKTEWQSLEVAMMPDLVGFLSVGVKFNRDGSSVSLCVAAKTTDDKVFTEVIDRRSLRDGVDWICMFCKSIDGKYTKVVADGVNGIEILEKGLKDFGLPKPYRITSGEYIQANTRFEQALFKKNLVHMRQPSVDNVISNVEKKPIGTQGGFRYESNVIGNDISIVDSMIIAHWTCEEFTKPKKVQKISY